MQLSDYYKLQIWSWIFMAPLTHSRFSMLFTPSYRCFVSALSPFLHAFFNSSKCKCSPNPIELPTRTSDSGRLDLQSFITPHCFAPASSPVYSGCLRLFFYQMWFFVINHSPHDRFQILTGLLSFRSPFCLCSNAPSPVPMLRFPFWRFVFRSNGLRLPFHFPVFYSNAPSPVSMLRVPFHCSVSHSAITNVGHFSLMHSGNLFEFQISAVEWTAQLSSAAPVIWFLTSRLRPPDSVGTTSPQLPCRLAHLRTLVPPKWYHG